MAQRSGPRTQSSKRMLPGDAVTPGEQAKPRSTPRIPVGHSAWVTLQTHDGSEHVAFVKDVSPRGIFIIFRFCTYRWRSTRLLAGVSEWLEQGTATFEWQGRTCRTKRAGNQDRSCSFVRFG